MKQTAIVSLLWGTQFEVLRQFLGMHNPMIVLARGGMLSPDMQTAIANTGSQLIFLDDLLDKALTLPLIASDADVLLEQFRHHLSASGSEGIASQNLPDGLNTIISETLSANLPYSLWLLESLTEAAEQFDIKLFVTSEDVTSVGKIATAWAKAHNIPSLLLSHSIALIDPYTVHNEVIADKLAVFGKRGMEGYRDLGFPEDRIIITGNPAWDGYTKLRQHKSDYRHHLNVKYQFTPKIPLIVFGTTYSANLSAHCNKDIFSDTLMAFLSACETLWEGNIQFNAVIKDHPSNRAFGQRRYAEILADMGLNNQTCTYCSEDGREFAVAADVLVGVDSNYLVEGMLARTPVINLMNATGMLMGPCFEAETGIIEAEWHELAGAIQMLLTDSVMRQAVIDMGISRASHYNHEDGDGRAAVRVAQVMTEMMPHNSDRYVWHDFFEADPEELIAAHTLIGRADLAAMYTNQPKLILDIGCATGSTAELIKQRFPGSRAWGIEMNRSAALIAKTKLDHILIGRFEEFDLTSEGISLGSIDAALLVNILEHKYNPWEVMLKLRPYISSIGQLVLSIPNVRNLMLIDDLCNGNWVYSKTGILDIKHIRFFTRKDILNLCYETGYRLIREQQTIDPELMHLWQQHQGLDGPYNLDLKRFTMKGITRTELLELCTSQFHLLIEINPTFNPQKIPHQKLENR